MGQQTSDDRTPLVRAAQCRSGQLDPIAHDSQACAPGVVPLAADAAAIIDEGQRQSLAVIGQPTPPVDNLRGRLM
jgi:hypothetical protein